MANPPMYPDDAKLYPVYEISGQRGTHVLFTLSALVGSDISYSTPVHVDRGAADLPDLKLIIRRACWPWVSETCGMAFRRENVYLIPDAYGVSMPGYMQGWKLPIPFWRTGCYLEPPFPLSPSSPWLKPSTVCRSRMASDCKWTCVMRQGC